jgi:hypothetical protein
MKVDLVRFPQPNTVYRRIIENERLTQKVRLQALSGKESFGEWAVVAAQTKKTMSVAARRKIAAFQRARWAKVKPRKMAA